MLHLSGVRPARGPDANATADDVPIMQNALCHRADSAEIKWDELPVIAGPKSTQSVASSRRKGFACIPRLRCLNRMLIFILIAFRLLLVMVIIIGAIHITTFPPTLRLCSADPDFILFFRQHCLLPFSSSFFCYAQISCSYEYILIL